MEAVRPERVEDEVDVLQNVHPMTSCRSVCHRKHKDEPTQEWPKDIVHQDLKGGRCIDEAKRHHQELKVAVMCVKCHLFYVLWVHAHLVMARAEVELGEEAGAMELIEELIDH